MRQLTLFLKLFIWFSIRHMVRHHWRAVAVICGIAIGAAVFTSVRLAVHASMDAFTQSMDIIIGQADRVVVNPGGRVPEQLVAELYKDDKIDAVSPMLSIYVMPIREPEDPFLLIGMDPILDRTVRTWSVMPQENETATTWLDLIRLPGSIIISQKLADLYSLHIHDDLIVQHAAQKMRFRIIGILNDSGLALVEGGMIAIVDIATFQEFTHMNGFVDAIDIVFKAGFRSPDEERLKNKLAPYDAILADPSESRKSGQQLIRAYQLNLSVLGFASLFVGMFLVYSLIALNAATRRPELAILRSMGASNRVVFQLFLTEGLVLGLTGWLIAIPAGSVMVSLMVAGISKTIATLFVRVNVDQISLSPWEILLSLGVTLFISAGAAYMPAREAMSVEPREVLSPIRDKQMGADRILKWFRIGLLCLLIIIPLSFMPGFAGFPLPGYLATILLFIGFALLTPYTLKRLSKIAAPYASRIWGEPGKLALRYITRSSTRTTVSVGALITAVALFTALVIMIHSFRQTVEIWVEQTVSGDLFVSPRMAELNRDRDLLDMDSINLVKQFSDTLDAVPLRKFYLSLQGVRFQLEAMDFKTFAKYGRFLWVDGDPIKAYQQAADGNGVLISEVMAVRIGLGMGKMFETVLDGKNIRLPVVGIVRDYRTQGGVVFCALSVVNEKMRSAGHIQPEKWSGVRLFLKEQRNGDPGGVIMMLRKKLLIQSEGSLDVIPGNVLRQKILNIFDETFAVTFILLLIALMTATLGIATTMTILVLERAKQLNTLIAIGADRSQIRRMIFCESGFLVIVGEILGLICGLILSFLLVYVINAQSFGWTFLYRVDFQMIWISLPLILGTAFLAALPAIRLVYRMPPADILNERAYA